VKDEGKLRCKNVGVGLGKYYCGILFVGIAVARLRRFTRPCFVDGCKYNGYQPSRTWEVNATD
jgi:hypothetical protein